MAKATISQQGKPTSLLSLVWKLQQSADEVLEAKLGAGLSQTRIMAALDKSAPRSQRHVAMELGQTEANVSRQLQTMKKKGLVSITKNKKDHRQRDVSLSPKGYRAYQKAEKLLKDHESGLMKLVDKKDRKTFETTASNLLKAL